MTCCRSRALCAARVAPAGLALCPANSAPEASHMTNAVFDEASCCETEGRQGYDPALQANRGGCRKYEWYWRLVVVAAASVLCLCSLVSREAKADYDVKSGEAS